ncbi:hypothetical protein JW319_22370 [Enterobacter cloacae subsp. cloacae]|uniref:hypothetical protein n=1 Tax=Enterobacter cloacae TaxID=550 RepID=UPI001C5B13BD|nr:hypothetical protein [Enterobacter cloacae]MBW4204104.1 hypothetical protein [Enterobacter cloacae subsp. cloacae]
MRRLTFILTGLSVLLLMLSSVLLWMVRRDNQTAFICSGSLTFYKDNAHPPLFTGRLAMVFEEDNSGYFSLTGKTEKKHPLQRFIFFHYQTRPSSSGMYFIIENFRHITGEADRAGPEEYTELLSSISQGQKTMRIRVQWLNPDTRLVSTVSHPFFICTSK